MRDNSDSALPQQLERLRESFKGRLPKMLDAIQSSWNGIRDHAAFNQQANTILEELFITVHRIAGSAGSFGFPEISRAAALLEDLLNRIRQADAGLRQEERDQIDVLIKSLIMAWEEGATEPLLPLVKPPEPGSESVYLIGQDHALADLIVRQLEQFGYKICTFSGPAEARLAMDAALPAAIIVDLRVAAAEVVNLQWLERLTKKASVIVLTDRSDITIRLAVVRAKCAAYLVEPVEIDELVYWLNHLTRRSQIQPYRILIVDDDAILAQTYSLILQSAGMDSFILNKPLKILETLSEQQPDLILMDVYMPECNGIDLAQVVRQHRTYANIPIIFLSVESDFSRKLVAKRLGGDEFLTKPVRPDHLIAAVSIWVVQSSSLRSVMESDSLTGLLNHVSIKERLNIELSRAQRQGLSLTFALMDLDHFKSVNDRFGHLAGDRVLKALANLLTRRLRKTDLIGRYGGEEFAVVLTHTSVDMALKIMNEVRESFALVHHIQGKQQFNVTLSCGVAGYDGVSDIDPDALIGAADKALYSAKTAGRNRVLAAN